MTSKALAKIAERRRALATVRPIPAHQTAKNSGQTPSEALSGVVQDTVPTLTGDALAAWVAEAPDAPVTTQDLIWAWLRQGWDYRLRDSEHMRRNKKAYRARMMYEMELIGGKDFLDYFAMLSDVVRYAKSNGIPVGPARGSAAASVVCWLLRITEVNPMLFPNMIFERFIDVNRMDLPDVDLDFDDELRYKIREHLVRRYGAERVGNLGNYTRYRGKNSIVDVCRVYQIPKFAEETVKGLVIERSGGDSRFDASLEDTFAMFPKAQEQLKRYPVLAHAMALEGNYKGLGVHAAGLVVCNSPITDFAALYAREVKGHKVAVVSVDKYDAEHLGLLKADFLGLTTMGMIRIALEMIDMPLEELYKVPLTEPDTLAAFAATDVVGIFQFEGRATRLVTRDVGPEHFSHLADISALARPGPLFSGATAAYVSAKHGRTPIEKFHPVVDALTHDTYGQIVYQEQILRIVRELGGFSYGDMGAIRKIISQKKGEAAFNKMQEQFVTGAKELHNVDRELSLRIWKKLVTSGTYSFNVAHCVSYSILGFWQMWLKVHHPVAFYAAQLRKTDKKKWGRLLKDAERHGVRVLPPSLNASEATWSPDFKANAVRAGYSQIPGIGEKTAYAIMEEGAARPFEDWKDLIRVKGIGPKTMQTIRAFAESEDPFQMEAAKRILDEVRGLLKTRALGPLPLPTHRSDDLKPEDDQLSVVYVGIPKSKNYQDYVENQRARTGEEYDEIVARMDHKDRVTSCVVHCYDEGDEDVYLRFERRFSFPAHKKQLEELAVDGSNVVVVAGLKREGFGIAIQVKKMWVLDVGDDDDTDDESDQEEN